MSSFHLTLVLFVGLERTKMYSRRGDVHLNEDEVTYFSTTPSPIPLVERLDGISSLSTQRS